MAIHLLGLALGLSAATAGAAALQGAPPPPFTFIVTWSNASSNVCLDLRGDNTTNGDAVEVWECNGLVNQQWIVDPSKGRVISDCHFRKTATEYDRKTDIKWLSCTALKSDNRM